MDEKTVCLDEALNGQPAGARGFSPPLVQNLAIGIQDRGPQSGHLVAYYQAQLCHKLRLPKHRELFGSASWLCSGYTHAALLDMINFCPFSIAICAAKCMQSR